MPNLSNYISLSRVLPMYIIKGGLASEENEYPESKQQFILNGLFGAERALLSSLKLKSIGYSGLELVYAEINQFTKK